MSAPKNIRLLLAAAAVTTAVAGCSSSSEAENAVKGLLNDPDSAKFTSVTERENGNVCGLVNAKNRMGGYVGATPFFYQANARFAAIVKAPEESDFRSLWLAIKTNSFTDELHQVGQGCSLASQWKDACGTAFPGAVHELCGAVAGDGVTLYHRLRDKYGS